jgi:hypothetical protein
MTTRSPFGEVIIPLRTSIPIYMTSFKHIPYTKQFGHRDVRQGSDPLPGWFVWIA